MRDLPAIEAQLAYLDGFGSDYLGVLFMGWFYGLTLCSFTCLPMLTPYLFATAGPAGQSKESGESGGFMSGFNLTALFIITRVAVYASLSGLAAGVGGLLMDWLDTGVVLPLAGGIITAIGVAVIFTKRQQACGGSCVKKGWRGTSHMVGLGIATSLMPCLPLTAVLTLASTRGSVLEGALLGLLFGIGAAATPLYYIGGATGWLASRIRSEIPKYMPLVQRLSGVLLAWFGLRLIFPG